MNDVKTPYQWVTVLVVSFTSYLVFHRYEPQSILNVSCLIFLLPAVMSWVVLPSPLTLVVIPMFLSYWFLILAFTVVYRVSPFHPLSKFPGPLINKITKLRVAYLITKGDRHIRHHQLHLKYGDMVRIGPNEVSYCNVDAVDLILGINGLPKGPLYCSATEDPGILYIKRLADYGLRRRTWNAGFSSSHLKRYEENIIRRSRELVDALRERTSVPVDMSKWMEFFTFDVMGDMVFSYPFDLIKSGEDVHGYQKAILKSIQPLVCFLQIPWFVNLTSGIFDAWGELRTVAGAIVKERSKVASDAGDLFYHFVSEEGKRKQKMTFDTLIIECYTAILAGSETTSTVLASLWYFLLQNPSCYHRLHKEVDDTFPAGEDPVDQQRLSEMPYLNACINETMRLIPAVPSGSQRAVPPESGGIMVGTHFVPAGNQIHIPPHSLHRDPRYFYPHPTSFWPDRWLDPKDRKVFDDATKPFVDHDKVVHNTTAFMPFSTGPRNCPGKNLAMIEMRIVVCSIVRNFALKAVEGYDVDEWEKHLGDSFTFTKGPLPVILNECV